MKRLPKFGVGALEERVGSRGRLWGEPCSAKEREEGGR